MHYIIFFICVMNRALRLLKLISHLNTTQKKQILTKIKAPKGGFHSDALEEPFWVTQRTFQGTILLIFFHSAVTFTGVQ